MRASMRTLLEALDGFHVPRMLPVPVKSHQQLAPVNDAREWLPTWTMRGVYPCSRCRRVEPPLLQCVGCRTLQRR